MQNIGKDCILVVDSDPDSITLYRLIFRDFYEVMIANNTIEAFELIHDKNIKVVITDYLQVSDSVIAFFEKIEQEFSFIQRILVISHSDHQLIFKAINDGRIFNYMIKPYDPQKLLRVVQNAIDQYNLQKKNHELVNDLTNKNAELLATLSELRLEEEKFRTIFNSSPDPIFIVDRQGRILKHNQHASILFGNDHPIMTNILISDLVVSADRDKTLNYILGLNEKEESMIEIQMMSKDEFQMDFEINGYPIVIQSSSVYMISLRNVSERKQMENRLLQSVIQTEEKERRRFAQELHDGIGPLLSTTKLYLQWFNKPDSKMDKSLIISKMEETLEETIANLREISNNISPNTLMNFGLNTAIRTFINRIRNVSNIEFHFKNQVSGRLKNELEVTIYRIICECINNTLKHADAGEINISMSENDGLMHILYEDNGKGFNSAEVMNKASGSGLINMKTRVNSLGGNIAFNSSIGQGTQISIEFSMNKI